MQIPFSQVDCSGNELKYIKEVLETGWLTTASKCQEFEELFRKKIGAKYACAVNSATSALHLACEAIGIGPGEKVFVPTMTFTSSAEILRYLGADPIFLDVEYGTCLLTPETLENAAKRYPEVKACVLVHFGGQSAQMDRILEICKKYGISLIEDAAHAFPTRFGCQMIGNFGDVTCFSFYANKTITTAEGGMLVTNNEEIFKRAKTMRLHGINRDIWDRFTRKGGSWEYDVIAPGFKYNLPDLNAVVGIAQLERAEEFRLARQKCAEFYFSEFSNISAIDLPVRKCSYQDNSWHLFWICLNSHSKIDRDSAIVKLNEFGIGTSVHYKPLHRMSYYRDRYELDPLNYPNAEKHWKGVISLPIYSRLGREQLEYVCKGIKTILV